MTETRGWYATWLPRIAAATVVVVAAAYGSQWVFTNNTDFLLMLIGSVFVAFALLPAVELLAKRGWRRGAATGVVMAGGAVVAVLFVGAMVRVAATQLVGLIGRLPDYADRIATLLNNQGIDADLDSVMERLEIDEQRVSAFATDVLGNLLGFATSAIGLVFMLFTMALFIFYLLADMPKLREAVLHRFPPKQQQHIDLVTTITIEKVGGYIYSRGLLAAASAVFHAVVFWMIDLPYPVAMAIWVGVISQFVPTIGTYLAGALPVIIALFDGWQLAVIVVLAITIYQQIENYLLQPRVTANTMALHPAIGFGSVLVGAKLLGPIGALIALPVAATVVALVQTHAAHYEIMSEGFVGTQADYEEKIRERAASKGKKGPLLGHRARTARQGDR